MFRELRGYLWAALAWFVVLELLLIGAIVFWPNFEDNIEGVKALVPMQSVKAMIDAIGRGGVATYVQAQHFFKGCSAIGTLAAVVLAMGAVAIDAQRGTLEILLARPLSRRRILTERWLAGAFAVAAPVFASSATVPWLLTYVDEEMDFSVLMLSSLHQTLFLLAIYSATFLWSCLSARPVVIVFGTLLMALFQFALYFVFEATHWSLFRLADIQTYALIGATGKLDPRMCWPLLGVIVALFACSQLAFARRVP